MSGIDHKCPQIRWSKDENINNDNMSTEMIKINLFYGSGQITYSSLDIVKNR
jgi:hypothetical protein